MSVVLITGVSRFLGGRLAALLAADPDIERVIGIDTVAPRPAERPLLGRTEFVRADIRNPLVGKVLSQARVSTVVHAALMASPHAVGGRVPMQELNVIGTMQLLAAARKSDTIERVVVRSTTAVYGSSPADPAVFTESMHPRDGVSSGYAKDAVEVEGYVRGFARRRPDITVSVLRMAEILGPTIDNALSRYLARPVVPTALGYDPRLQLLHETDAVEVLRLASVGARPGVVNVAGDGVVLLSQVVRQAGRLRVPVISPALGTVGAAVRNPAASDLITEEARFLLYGRAVDTTRLRQQFGYTPRYSSAQTVAAYVDAARPGPRLALAALTSASHRLQAHYERWLAVAGS